eukprot:TRINITY_DN100531_c0_g1_i1.p1 TRINITY_DN100531_c0_g1~~TRINITY_DN100531_c0_g1_i1.p1  ORF type:complete len:335 (+),score=76.84 TRINITY_DN100531_c0_g1_i1:79-1083(+)
MQATRAAAIAAVLALGSHAEVEDPDALVNAFADFMNKYNKTYSEDEKTRRFQIFRENMEFIEAENKKGHGYTLGVTPFTDKSHDEMVMKQGFLWEEPEAASKMPPRQYQGTALPGSVDWVSKGVVTPIKSQGTCQSCWTFSTTGALEGAYAIATGTLKSLSEQFFLDCVPSGDCTGGYVDKSLNFAETHDVCTEDGYQSYHEAKGSCNSCNTTAFPSGTFDDFEYISNDINAVMEMVATQPVSVSVDATSAWQHYTGGIMNYACSSTNHAVLIVGYGSENGVEYWKIKNQWSSSWGENGYIRLKRGDGSYSITCEGSYTTRYPRIPKIVEQLVV